MASSTRLTSLDGLRGVAALVVVVHHCLLVSPSLAAAYYGGETNPTPLGQALIYTPLHLVWGGAEAVVVFFVLSGFVLARMLRSPRFEWGSYFPSRLLRLYVPVAGAVAFTFLMLLLPHDGAPPSPWLDRDAGYPFVDVLRDLTLVGGSSGVLSPLWTLRWEILFSLLLPVFAYAVRLIPAWALGVVSLAVSAVGASQDVASLQYLPIFGVGVAIAGEWSRLTRWSERMPRRAAVVVWPALVALAIVMLSSYWMLLPLIGHGLARALAQAPIVLGAGILVVAAVHWHPVQRVLASRPIAWLGAVSFSLYLVHEPIVILMANLTDDALPTLLLSVPIALLMAWLFFLAVERPAHRFAQRVRSTASLRRAPSTAEVRPLRDTGAIRTAGR